MKLELYMVQSNQKTQRYKPHGYDTELKHAIQLLEKGLLNDNERRSGGESLGETGQ